MPSSQIPSESNGDIGEFQRWLVSDTVAHLLVAKGNMPKTREALIRFFQTGLRGGLGLEDLMQLLPVVFGGADYSLKEGRNVIEMLRALKLEEIGPCSGSSQQTGCMS